jgi:hypothetical protein
MKILTLWPQHSHLDLVQPIRLRSHTRETKPASWTWIAGNWITTPTRPRPETWACSKLGSRPTKAYRLSENSSIRNLYTHVRCCSHRVGGKGIDPCPMLAPNWLRLSDREIRVKVGFGFASGEYQE